MGLVNQFTQLLFIFEQRGALLSELGWLRRGCRTAGVVGSTWGFGEDLLLK
jgi:hypothetical protein